MEKKKERWFEISDSSNYHFPGVFSSEFPQRMGFCADISMLPNYEPTDKHFLFTDIQLGKGKARPVIQVKILIDGTEEAINYWIVPCGGIKLYGSHSEVCTYIGATRETRPCFTHPRVKLVHTGTLQ